MREYLLDTNICVYLLRGEEKVLKALSKVGWNNCFISEITVAELVYGAECSSHVAENKSIVEDLCNHFQIVPISSTINEFARQKAILRKEGKLIEDSDLWIGVAAVVKNMTMVTENTKHLSRIEGIQIANWLAE